MDIKQGQTLLIGWLQMHGIPCRERFVIVEILILQSSSILANIRSKLKLLYVNKSLKIPKE